MIAWVLSAFVAGVFMLFIFPPPPEFWRAIGAGFTWVGRKIGLLLAPVRNSLLRFADRHPRAMDALTVVVPSLLFVGMFATLTAIIHSIIVGA
jgi:hypothetical protein